jgi:hypothetical protein
MEKHASINHQYNGPNKSHFRRQRMGNCESKNFSDCPEQMNTTSFAQAGGFDAAPHAPRLC